ncbi:glycosyltransferase family 2 protein [Microvirga arabica]|uniref:glycosyltransferase family 2 protein n=1 Tax=Microvirga arabica TaxID=1128671 RepID=UPI00193AB0DA|nr:glycosyltransferase [Microvirga arabica]MBM1175445.1 glycosyltransferase [Microvirga arabica]
MQIVQPSLRDGSPTAAPRLRLAIGIASVGRPSVLLETVRWLQLQTRAPDAIVVCVPSHLDAAGLTDLCPNVQIITGARGLTRQRNAICRALNGFDLVIFFDDDFVASSQYLEEVEDTFLNHPNIVIATGRVIADGISGEGICFEAATEVVQGHESNGLRRVGITDVSNGYGCNMAVRLAPVQENNIEFDENLPLYGWLEDVDFSRQLARYGRIVRLESAQGVHLGVKSGRQSGARLGYSQVANPLYLVRKGTCSWKRALFLMSRNISANVVCYIRPEPYVDRRGRLKGNVRALLELLAGRLHPSRILTF